MRPRALAIALSVAGCLGDTREPATIASTLPIAADTLVPVVVTERVRVDADDPAVWVHPTDPARSLVIGTDKGNTDGGLYVFDLDGRIDRARSVTPLARVNNVDVRQGVRLGDWIGDIAVATERNRQRLRVFALPEMRAIDGGGIVVFDGDVERAPMGVALYRRPADSAVFAIVGGKSGPGQGYLWQYRLTRGSDGIVRGQKVREVGAYSGRKEVEAIAVDDALGFVYYSDEGTGIRKYFASPDSGNAELALFATTGVVADHEGIAIFARDATTGYLLLSDQQGQRIHVFPREGTDQGRDEHPLMAIVPVRALETDGIEATSRALGPRFPAGMLVMMSTDGTYQYYDWRDVQRAIDAVGRGRR